MLTESSIKAIKTPAKRLRKSDGGGLFLEVAPTGRKTFKVAYRRDGAQCNVVLGEFPAVKLAAARRQREEIKATLAAGGDPREIYAIRAIPAAAAAPEAAHDTWREWCERYIAKRQREGAAEATIFKRTLHAERTYPVMGDKPIRDCTARDVIEACRTYEEEGKLTSAQAVRTLCGQVFRFAIAHGAAEYDPAGPARDALARPVEKGYPGITDPNLVGKLMRDVRGYQASAVVRAGLLLSAYLFPRGWEIRQMRWDQIEGDVWEVPAEAMKKKRVHLVPLPTQARQVLAWVEPLTGDGPLVLPSRSSHDGKLSENTLNIALRRMGYANKHCHHGFRKTASTNLYEAGFRSEWIELQLSHVEGNKVKGAYNKAQYMDGRLEMMQWYADWLDAREADQ